MSDLRAEPMPKASTAKTIETKQKYMDAAEKLFIELGYEGTSIRAISALAKMNLGTVVYHWGTKEALFRDICLRRFVDIHEEQVRRLTVCEDASGRLSKKDLPDVLRALVEPPLLMPKTAAVGAQTRLLYGRVLTDPSPAALKVTTEIFGPATELFRSLTRKCLSDLSEDSFHWRYICAVGAFVIAQSFEPKFTYALGLPAVEPDWSRVVDEIVSSMAAGLTRE